MEWSRVVWVALTCFALGCENTESRIIVAPDGSKALYVECKESPVECLAAISQECRGGYEVLAQGTREETLMLDKVTEAGTQAAASKVSPNAKGIQATPSNIRQMLVRCGHTTTASTDLKKLLDMNAPSSAHGSVKPASPPAPPASTAAADDSEDPIGHTCPGADANLRHQRAAQWKNILSVQKAGVSQPGVSAELACNMARRLFVERCPDWSPYVPQVERAVCTIASGEAERAARVAKAPAPVGEHVELEESP